MVLDNFPCFWSYFPLSLKKYGGTAVAREAKNLNQENVVLLKSQLRNQDCWIKSEKSCQN